MRRTLRPPGRPLAASIRRKEPTDRIMNPALKTCWRPTSRRRRQTIRTPPGRSFRKSPCWVCGEGVSSSTRRSTAARPCGSSTDCAVSRRISISRCSTATTTPGWTATSRRRHRTGILGIHLRRRAEVGRVTRRESSPHSSRGAPNSTSFTSAPRQTLPARLPSNQRLRIKLEMDLEPPPFATTEVRTQLLPSPYQVRLYDLRSLFAGKLHAVLCRGWKKRVKGRDFYDFVWYVGTQCRAQS